MRSERALSPSIHASLLVSLGLVSACSPAPLFIPYPNTPFESALLVLEEGGAPSWVVAVSGGGEVARTPEIDPGDGVALEAILSTQSLSELSMSPGLIPADPEGYCLPFEDARVFRNTIEPDLVSGWAEMGSASPASRRFRRAATPEPCRFDVTASFSVPSSAPVQILVGQESGERLLAGGPEGLHVFDSTGDIVFQDLEAWCAGERVSRTDRVILAKCSGQVFEIDLSRSPLELDDQFQLSESDNGIGGLVSIAAQDVTRGLEVFMVNQAGLVLRWTSDEGVERLHDYQRSTETVNYLGGLALLGPGHAVAGLEDSAELFEYQAGLTRFINFGSDSGISTIQASAFGLMIGTTTGALWHRGPRDTEFKLLEGSPNRSWLVAIETLPNGDYLYALTFGSVGLYEFGRGFCGPEILSAQSHRRLTRFGSGYAVSGQNSGVTRIPITLFDVQGSGRSLTRDCEAP